MVATFNTFEFICLLAVYFGEDMDQQEINDTIQDWYTMYKQDWSHLKPTAFLKEHLQDVSRKTHSFWLDTRGLALVNLCTIVLKCEEQQINP